MQIHADVASKAMPYEIVNLLISFEWSVLLIVNESLRFIHAKIALSFCMKTFIFNTFVRWSSSLPFFERNDVSCACIIIISQIYYSDMANRDSNCASKCIHFLHLQPWRAFELVPISNSIDFSLVCYIFIRITQFQYHKQIKLIFSYRRENNCKHLTVTVSENYKKAIILYSFPHTQTHMTVKIKFLMEMVNKVEKVWKSNERNGSAIGEKHEWSSQQTQYWPRQLWNGLSFVAWVHFQCVRSSISSIGQEICRRLLNMCLQVCAC